MQTFIGLVRGPDKTSEETSEHTSDQKSEAEKKEEFKQNLISTFKEFIIWVIILLIIMGSLYGYTGRWPPVVVVESNSMMHGDDSSFGTMDTGDIVLVKKISDREDIKTYVEGLKDDYKTYGSYGDVIGFKKNGDSGTPVIHRAVVWIEYNPLGKNNIPSLNDYGSFDVPSMGLFNVTSITIDNYGPDKQNLTINLTHILWNFQTYNREPHSGFLTKGDNNANIDQLSGLTDEHGQSVEPVEIGWIVGKGVGELPGLGLIKLYFSGETSKPGKSPPASNVNILFVITVLIVIVIIILHFLFLRIEKKRRKRREAEEDRKLQPFQTKIVNRIRLKNSDKSTNEFRRKPRKVKKDTMLSYLDTVLESDGMPEGAEIQKITVQKLKASNIKKGTKSQSSSPIAKPGLKTGELKTGHSLKSDQSPPKGPYIAASQNTTPHEPPYSHARPSYPRAIEQSKVTHNAPRAKPVSKEDMLSYLDEVMDEQKK